MKKSFFKFLHVFLMVAMIAWTFGPSLGLLVNTASADEITPVVADTQVAPVVVPTTVEPVVTPADATPVVEPVIEATTTTAVEPVVEATTTPAVQSSIEQTTQIVPFLETPATEVLATPEVATVTPKEIWANSGNKAMTNDSVELNKTYTAPQNNQVTVTFTKLPATPGKLSIEEITLTPEQITSLGALSDKAYDISSDMTDGSFAYDLTLPKPVNQENVQIKFSEDVAGLKNADTVANSDVKTKTDSVSASLDHFTIFVVANFVVTTPLQIPSDKACINDDCYPTIQAAIDAAKSGDTIKVYPGNYDETAVNRLVNGANYQFGLFVGTDKNDLTIEGVDTNGNPITDALSTSLPYITTNATNNFGTSGIFISGNNVTIKGVRIGPNASGDNKTIEIIGDNFTLQYSKIDVADGGSVYFNDYSGAGTTVNKYNVLNNIFALGASLDIASGAGAGVNSPVTDRQIIGNTFQGANVAWALVSFTGTGGEAWFAYPVGGAVITGNNFSGGTQYIRARGVYENSQFDWKSYWENNTFDKKVVDLSDVPTFSVQPFFYDSFTNVRRIGSLIQPEIDNAQVGDTIKVGAGTYDEQLNITKSLDLIGNSSDTTTIKTPAIFTENIYQQKNIIEVKNNAIANISNVTVSGPGLSGCGSIHYGLYVIGGATLNLSDSKITNISDAPFSGCQNGVAIRVGQSSLSQSGTATINNVIITNYQKGGIVIDGQGSSATITNNIITGAGTTAVIAQNGIQISRGATAIISGNTVTDNSYHLDDNDSDWGSTGILLYQSGAVTMSGGNIINGNDLNIDKYSNSGALTIHNNSIGLSTAPASIGFGVKNEDLDTVDATNNYWGDASGPKDTKDISGTPNYNNPTGLGSAVSSYVDYKPWFIDSKMATPVSSAPITQDADVTLTDAMLNGTNGNFNATDHTFWVSLSTFVPALPVPTGIYSTPSLGPISAGVPFTPTLLSSLTTNGVPSKLPTIKPNTTYYYAAWSEVGDTWYPGTVKTFTTAPATVKVTITKYVNGVQATAVNTNSASFPMSATWNATNIGSGTGSYALSTTGFNNLSPYEATTADMTVGANYSTNETAATSCTADYPFSFVGYSTGDTLEAAAEATKTTDVPNFTNLTSDKFIIVWNKTCPPAPVHISPADNTLTTTANQTSIDWTDVTADPATPITYVYQASNYSATNTDGSFISPIFTSDPLPDSQIPTAGTPEGVYYWHVQAVDAVGNSSPWSTAGKITVDNTTPTATLVFPTTPGPSAKSFQVVFSEDVNAQDAKNPTNYFLNNWPGTGGSGDLVGDANITYDATSKTATINFTNSAWYISAEQQWGVQNIHDLAGNLLNPASVTDYSTLMKAPVTTATLVGTEGLNDFYTSSVTVNLTADDGDSTVGSGVKATYYSIDNAEFTQGNSVLVSTDGEHTVKYYSTDNAGNTEVEKTVNFKIDSQAPAGGTLTMKTKLFPNGVTATLADNVYTITPALSITGADVFQSLSVVVNDNNLNTASVPAYIDNVENGSMIYNDGVWNYSNQVGMPVFVAGPHTISATFKDLAGNTKTLTANFTTDNAGPVGGTLTMKTKLFPNGVTATLAGNVYTIIPALSITGVDVFQSLSVVVNDDSLNTASVPAYIDGVENGSMVYNNGVWNYSNQVGMPVFVAGQHTISATFADNAGNLTTLNANFTTDATAPVGGTLTMRTKLFPNGVPTTLANNVYTITPALSLDGADVFQSLSVVVTDDNIETSNVPVYIDGNTNANGYMQYDSSAQVWNYANQTAKPDFSTGPHTLSATFKDLAGNAATLIANFTTDNTAPIITLTGTTTDITVGGVYTELGATTDDSSAVNITGTVNTSLAGTYTVTYNATDSAGNIATPVTRTVNVVSPIINVAQDNTLSDAKTAALETINNAFATYNPTDYTKTNWLILTGFETDGLTTINTATAVDQVNTAKNTSVDSMAGVAKKLTEKTPLMTLTSSGGGGGTVNYCSNVEYGEWGNAVNGIQERGILSRTPNNCSFTSEQISGASRTVPSPVEQQVLGVKVYADGTLLKGTNGRIFVVIGGKLQYISSLKELAKYAGKPILKVDDATISSFAKTAVLGAVKYADGTLIKAKGDVKIYVIENGKKVHIKSLAELKQYKGKTLTVEASELNNY